MKKALNKIQSLTIIDWIFISAIIGIIIFIHFSTPLQHR